MEATSSSRSPSSQLSTVWAPWRATASSSLRTVWQSTRVAGNAYRLVTRPSLYLVPRKAAKTSILFCAERCKEARILRGRVDELPILPSAFAAERRTPLSMSFCALMRAGMAEASPISPSASAAKWRKNSSVEAFSTSMRVGTAEASPISPVLAQRNGERWRLYSLTARCGVRFPGCPFGTASLQRAFCCGTS